MSSSILFFHVYFFPFVGPEAQVTCSLPFNKYSFFFIVCVSVGIFRALFLFLFFFFIDRMAWTECLSWEVRSSELIR